MHDFRSLSAYISRGVYVCFFCCFSFSRPFTRPFGRFGQVFEDAWKKTVVVAVCDDHKEVYGDV